MGKNGFLCKSGSKCIKPILLPTLNPFQDVDGNPPESVPTQHKPCLRNCGTLGPEAVSLAAKCPLGLVCKVPVVESALRSSVDEVVGLQVLHQWSLSW